MRDGSGVNKKVVIWGSWYCCFEIDKKMASEESKTTVEVLEIPVGDLPDELPRDEFAARVLKAVKDSLMIMKGAVSDSTDNLLKKEMTKLADDVIRFRQAMSTRMLSDEEGSRVFGEVASEF